METRYRWYKLKIPRGQDIENKLKRYQAQDRKHAVYFQGAEVGVEKFQYVSKKVIAFDLIDEDGNPGKGQVEAIEVTVFAFVKTGRKYFIRLENPSRNVGDLMSLLEKLVGFGFAIKPVVFSNLELGLAFGGVDEKKITSLKVSNVVLGRDIVSQMEFRSTSGLTPDKIKVLKGLSYKVDGIVYELYLQGISGRLSMSSSGVVRIAGRLAPRILDLLEEELPD